MFIHNISVLICYIGIYWMKSQFCAVLRFKSELISLQLHELSRHWDPNASAGVWIWGQALLLGSNLLADKGNLFWAAWDTSASDISLSLLMKGWLMMNGVNWGIWDQTHLCCSVTGWHQITSWREAALIRLQQWGKWLGAIPDVLHLVHFKNCFHV